jgi:hypothetical protein
LRCKQKPRLLPPSLAKTQDPRGAPIRVGLRASAFEWAFAGKWSARDDFIGLNNQAFTTSPGPAPFGGDVINTNNRNIQLLTVGFDYKFGGWWGY